MSSSPQSILGEVLGVRSFIGQNPADQNYICPFIKSPCTKRSPQLGLTPYPVCSLWKGTKSNFEPHNDLIAICPKRFYAVNFIEDVIEHCWSGSPPENPRIAKEVKMEGFGNVDFVIADLNSKNVIGQFLSVELQAIDISGSIFPAYQALLNGRDLESRPTYGLNWDNVYKRYITQLIRKGYFHHHWNSKIIAVIQDQVYQYITDRADFMRSTDVKNPNVNIIFMTYRFEDDPDAPGQFRPLLQRVEGTAHTNLQSAFLYKNAPSRLAFESSIKTSLERNI